MGEDRLSSLAFMNIHLKFERNTDKVIEEFKKKIIIGAFLMKLTAQIVIYVRTVLLAIRQFLYDDQNDTLLYCISMTLSFFQARK